MAIARSVDGTTSGGPECSSARVLRMSVTSYRRVHRVRPPASPGGLWLPLIATMDRVAPYEGLVRNERSNHSVRP
jgi:hypothetical protein